jgi:hypothetical protein
MAEKSWLVHFNSFELSMAVITVGSHAGNIFCYWNQSIIINHGFRVGLTESGNVQCRKYSGGMKRRLSAAMVRYS